MSQIDHATADSLLDLLADGLASRLADRVKQMRTEPPRDSTPWLTRAEAIDYTRLPEGTFRKLVTSGIIPSHGGRAKLFYRPELDEALLHYRGIGNDERRLKRVR